jgi:hypothetical protein
VSSTTTNPTPERATGAGDRQPARPADCPEPGPARRDWSWRHGPVWGSVNAAGACASAAMLGELGGASPLLAAGAGLAGAGGSWVASARQQVTRGTQLFRLVCFLGAGAWGTWALGTSPWSPDVLGALVGGAAALGVAAPAVAGHEHAVSQRRAEAARAVQRQAIARQWEERLARVCRIQGARVTAVKTMSTGGGYSMHIQLPADGTGWRTVAGYADQLADSARLPEGCGVEARRATHRGAMILDVYTANALAQEWPYPVGEVTTAGPWTVNRPLPIGRYRDLAEVEIDLLDTIAIIIGQIGSGKTNLLQVINAALVRCVDTIVWHIDLNGGGMSSPWAGRWLDEPGAPLPAIDWIATTIEEAIRLTEAAIAIGDARKRGYRARMRKVNDDKLPIDAHVPEIVIVLDEGAEAVGSRGNTRLAKNIDKIITTGRAMRVRLILTGVRATGDVLSNPNLRVQAGTRIAMNGSDDAEIAYLTDWHRGASSEDTVAAGDFHIQVPGVKGLRVGRSYRIKPDQIAQVNQLVQPWRPRLDQLSAAAAGPYGYEERWQRYRSVMTSQDTDPREDPDMTQQPAGAELSPHEALRQAQAALAARIAEMGTQPDSDQAHDIGDGEDGPEKDWDGALHQLLVAEYGPDYESMAGPPTPPPTESDGDDDTAAAAEAAAEAAGDVHPARARLLPVLREAGDHGLSPRALHARFQVEGLGVTRQSLHRWLREEIDAGTVRQVRRGIYAAVINPGASNAG